MVLVSMVIGVFMIQIVATNLDLEEKPVALGATFSKKYAESLGLDWKETYLAMLDDLKVKRLRIPAYWDDIEPEPGVYNFSIVDWQLQEAAKRGVTVILAVGRKLPRWPECHAPAWTEGTPESLLRAKILTMVQTVVEHYRDNPTIVQWQVENEPFFKFGHCPEPNRALLEQEIAVVRVLDSRPIVISESGELSTWLNAASLADVLGISTYRIVWDKYLGYFFWPITPRYYISRAEAVRTLVGSVIITELQAEPWVTGAITHEPIESQLKLMNAKRLEDNVAFARRIGFTEAYLWGVEWWYWLKKQGHPELWEAGKKLYASPFMREAP